METAVRETREEIGLDAPLHTIIGALDELRPRSALLPAIVVTPYVAQLAAPGPLTLNHEVADAFWVPWTQLTDPANDQVSEVHARGSTWRTPSFVIGQHIVWGMTERILRQLMSRTLP
jgi:8-oxo-dGTP pyrophosphatase MutT (NUDIX family)